MTHILAIELRRSAALGTALILAAIGTLLIYLAEGIYFAEGWIQLAMTQRWYLVLMWPLALTAGAWQARREHRSNVAELFAGTPRPRASRSVPTLGAMAIAVVGGYLVQGIAGAVWIFSTAGYLPVAVFAVTAVGALALIAAVWLGQAVGRFLPSVVTAPALGIAGLALLLLIPGATRPRGWLALVFSPNSEMNMPDAYTTVPGRVSGAQAIWVLALATAAVLLIASTSRRIRLAALLPVVAGAALAIVVMPHQNRIVTDAADPVARALVCADGTPRVCVSRVHSRRLSEVTTQARQGLAVLAKLPDAPTTVHEDTYSYRAPTNPTWQKDVAVIPVGAGTDDYLASVVTGAFTSAPECDKSADPAEMMAAAYWLIGREPRTGDVYDAAFTADAVKLWQGLRALPENEAQARVTALRQAAVTCTVTDGQLSGGTR